MARRIGPKPQYLSVRLMTAATASIGSSTLLERIAGHPVKGFRAPLIPRLARQEKATVPYPSGQSPGREKTRILSKPIPAGGPAPPWLHEPWWGPIAKHPGSVIDSAGSTAGFRFRGRGTSRSPMEKFTYRGHFPKIPAQHSFALQYVL